MASITEVIENKDNGAFGFCCILNTHDNVDGAINDAEYASYHRRIRRLTDHCEDTLTDDDWYKFAIHIDGFIRTYFWFSSRDIALQTKLTV